MNERGGLSTNYIFFVYLVWFNPYHLFFWTVVGWLHEAKFNSYQGGELDIFVEFKVATFR